MVGVTLVDGLWSVAGRWAVVLYYAAIHLKRIRSSLLFINNKSQKFLIQEILI